MKLKTKSKSKSRRQKKQKFKKIFYDEIKSNDLGFSLEKQDISSTEIKSNMVSNKTLEEINIKNPTEDLEIVGFNSTLLKKRPEIEKKDSITSPLDKQLGFYYDFKNPINKTKSLKDLMVIL